MRSLDCGLSGPAMRVTDPEEREVTVLRSAEVSDAVPREVLVAPWGVVESANGTFVVDEEGARLAIAAFEAQGTDLPIDYEHQTLGGGYASPTGQAPAAGWIKRLFVVRPVGIACKGDRATDGRSDEENPVTRAPSFSLGGRAGAGLYAEVEWTEPARAQLAARQYRYLSPVAIVRKSDRRLVALHSAALTNKPAILGMRAIVNRDPGFGFRVPGCAHETADGQEDASCDNAEGRGRGAAEQGRRRRKEVREMTEVLERLRGQLGLAKEEEGEAVLLAASERIESLTEAARRSEAESRVAAAMEAGKLTEAQREWAVSLAMKDAAAFEAWEASAPVVVQVGRLDGITAEGGPVTCGGAEREKAVIAAKARAEFRANPALALLTSEEAYVALALRETQRSGE